MASFARGARHFGARTRRALCDEAPRRRDITSQLASNCYVLQERRAYRELNLSSTPDWSAPDLRLF